MHDDYYHPQGASSNGFGGSRRYNLRGRVRRSRMQRSRMQRDCHEWGGSRTSASRSSLVPSRHCDNDDEIGSRSRLMLDWVRECRWGQLQLLDLDGWGRTGWRWTTRRERRVCWRTGWIGMGHKSHWKLADGKWNWGVCRQCTPGGN